MVPQAPQLEKAHPAIPSTALKPAMNSLTITIDLEDISIEKADAQIRTLQGYLQKLFVARNSAIPINRLPPDVLLEIFALVGKKWEMDAACSMLNLSWVSHYWRVLALGSPTHWTVITNSNLRWADKCLERSGSSPLSVGLFIMKQDDVDNCRPQLKTLFSRISRMKTFHLSLCDDMEASLAIPKGSWKLPASFLTSLRLDGVTLRGNFLSAITNVRDLFLKECEFPWEPSAVNYPHLTSLHIASPHSQVSTNQLVRLLHKMPSLQRLVLIEMFDWNDDGDEDVFITPPTGVQQPPRLRTLKMAFGEALDSSLRLLQCALQQFATDQTVISCTANLTVFDDALQVLPRVLSSFSKTLMPRQVTTIKFNDLDSNSRSMEDGAAMLHINYQEGNSEHHPTSSFVLEIEDTPIPTLLATLQESLTLTHVEGIHFNMIPREMDITSLVNIFGGLQELHYFDFQLESVSQAKFLRALLPRDGDNATPLRFPSLGVLGTLAVEDEDDLRLAYRVLSKRKRLGYPIHTAIWEAFDDEWQIDVVRKLTKIIQCEHMFSTTISIFEDLVFRDAEPVSEGSEIKPFGGDE